MAEPQSQRHGSSSALEPGSSRPANAKQQPLSCSHCRQKKVKCDKVHPCTPCARSGLPCVFPERLRHPKRRGSNSKTANDELVRRLSRMEELIEKMKIDGKDIHGNKIAEDRHFASPRLPDIGQESIQKSDTSNPQRENPKEGGVNNSTLFTGGAFLKSLVNEARPAFTYPAVMRRRADSHCSTGRRPQRIHG